MRKKKVRIALAIPTYNREEVLLETLRSCFALSPGPDEILVVDQTEEHEERAKRFLGQAEKSGRIRYIRQAVPNLPMARNRALRETKCDVVIFIDDDVVLPKDFVRQHVFNFQDPKVDGVAGRVEQDADHPLSKTIPPPHWPRVLDSLYFQVDSNKRVVGIAAFRGCNHSVRVRKALDLGGYDENFIGGAVGEENDMALRIWKSGGLIVFDPKARLFHLVAPSGGCRVYGVHQPAPEWVGHFPVLYFSFRHHFPSLVFWYLTGWSLLWAYPIRKVNRKRPWVIPWSLVAYVFAWFRAGLWAYRKGRHEISSKSADARRQLKEFDRRTLARKFGFFNRDRASVVKKERD